MNKQLIERVKEEFVILGLFSKVEFFEAKKDTRYSVTLDGDTHFVFETIDDEMYVHIFRGRISYRTRNTEDFLKYISKKILDMADDL